MKDDNLNKQYEYSELLESDLEDNPVDQFDKWFSDAVKSGIKYPNSFCLATASSDSRPNARMLLLKEYNNSGFVFYTNSESIKGIELQQNPKASMVFWWDKLERQVRISGKIEVLPESESDEYFKSRPRGSQIGAWASKQSCVLESREALDSAFVELEKKYGENLEIPRPKYWKGYKLRPTGIEFWQGRPNRLHDRLKYTYTDNHVWVVHRLAP